MLLSPAIRSVQKGRGREDSPFEKQPEGDRVSDIRRIFTSVIGPASFRSQINRGLRSMPQPIVSRVIQGRYVAFSLAVLTLNHTQSLTTVTDQCSTVSVHSVTPDGFVVNNFGPVTVEPEPNHADAMLPEYSQVGLVPGGVVHVLQDSPQDLLQLLPGFLLFIQGPPHLLVVLFQLLYFILQPIHRVY